MRAIFCGSGWLDIVPVLERAIRARGIDANVFVRDASRPLAEQLADVDVIFPSNAHVGAREIAAARCVKLIQQPAAGHEGIDAAAARAHGIPVCNAPGTNVDAVAQATMLLLLALARRLPRARASLSRAEIGVPVGVELVGRTLLVVGLGRTGARVAELARAFGMKVESVRSADGRAGLLRALPAADFVSVHVPLTPSTRALFDDAAFAAMRPGACLINVARGGIVDRDALDRALASNRLGGVGLDVFWNEPWDPRDALFSRDDVVALPHVAGSTEEAFARIAEVCAHNVEAIVRGGELMHRIA
jgi:D-3-phosphoglycerate dehydrogenase